MDHDPKPRRSKSLATHLVLAALLGLAAVGLTQCRLVGNSITGVQLDASGTSRGRSQCMKACTREFRAGVQRETARYRTAVRACGRDRECITAERQIHKQNLAALVTAMQLCKRACYNEGGGGGGR